tara:strand:- start:1464 stop:1676 length:213 start_codon:yes stop_codon:yes gene_type:complete
MERNWPMSDDKMTNASLNGKNVDQLHGEETVVQALDLSVWSEADAENKIQAKLDEFAAEMQTIKSFQDVS